MIKVTNRTIGETVYTIEELKIRRLFTSGETKEITPQELEALWQMPGGQELVMESLLIQDKDWVESHWEEVPIEYFWTTEDVKTCLREDSLELFEETLQYAPVGVLELIKHFAWSLPISDKNKMDLILKHLDFDVIAAIATMAESAPRAPQPGKTRLRKEA